MMLSEKLLCLRTQRGLSQEDLAGKLEVSRQSVSKWETGQSIPDLDKIIKLADLFGVTVDELVREGERPQPPEPPQPQVAYVEREGKQELSPVQKLGIVMEVSGVALAIIGLMGAPMLILAALALVILGLPLLLAKKHPFLIAGWLVLIMSILFLNPSTGVTASSLRRGLESIYYYFAAPGPGRESLLVGGIITVAQRVLAVVLVFFTWRAWKSNRFPEENT